MMSTIAAMKVLACPAARDVAFATLPKKWVVVVALWATLDLVAVVRKLAPCRGLELLMMRRWRHDVEAAPFNFCLT